MIAGLEARGFLEPEAEKLKAELTLRAGARDAGDLATRREEAAAHPGDLEPPLQARRGPGRRRPVRRGPRQGLSIVEEGPRTSARRPAS